MIFYMGLCHRAEAHIPHIPQAAKTKQHDVRILLADRNPLSIERFFPARNPSSCYF